MKPLLVIGLVLVALGSGCGKKGPPRAPELVMPRPIKNLSARRVGNDVVLTWSRPTEYVDGTEIKDLAGFVIFRKDITPKCADCPVAYRRLTTVNVEDREKFVKQKRYRYVDEQALPTMTYRYRVLSQLLDGSVSDPSNEVEVLRGP